MVKNGDMVGRIFFKIHTKWLKTWIWQVKYFRKFLKTPTKYQKGTNWQVKYFFRYLPNDLKLRYGMQKNF